MRWAELRFRRGKAFEVDGFDVEDAFLDLHDAVDDEGGLLDDEQPTALEELRVDDDVRDAGLVFEAEEERAVCGAGPLAADDGAAGEDARAVGGALEVAGAPEVRQAVAHE